MICYKKMENAEQDERNYEREERKRKRTVNRRQYSNHRRMQRLITIQNAARRGPNSSV